MAAGGRPRLHGRGRLSQFGSYALAMEGTVSSSFQQFRVTSGRLQFLHKNVYLNLTYLYLRPMARLPWDNWQWRLFLRGQLRCCSFSSDSARAVCPPLSFPPSTHTKSEAGCNLSCKSVFESTQREGEGVLPSFLPSFPLFCRELHRSVND